MRFDTVQFSMHEIKLEIIVVVVVVVVVEVAATV